jgi:NAD-dependent dihydropyrimidine dehydrogenase PreA subunit
LPERRPAVPPVVLEKRCTGCGACISACRPKVIEMRHREDGRKLAFVHADGCQLHGDCLAACPHEALFAWKWTGPPTI